MRIKGSDPMWSNVDEIWRSSVTSGFINAARTDPKLWPKYSNEIAGFNATALSGSKAWAASQRAGFFYQGTGALGLPGNTISAVAEGMGPLVMNPPDNLDALFTSLINTAIGIALDLVSAIPIVGPIAKAIGNLALMLRGLSDKSPEEASASFPPAVVYEPDAEERVMNDQVLPVLTSRNWTSLFLPRMNTNLSITGIDNGYIMKSLGGSGLGFIPGTQQISGDIQAAWKKRDDRGGSLGIHQDVGNFYPGPAQLVTAISQQVQRPGAEMYSVDPDAISRAWKDYIDGVFEYIYELFFGRNLGGTGFSGLSDEHRRIMIQQLVAPLLVGTLPNGDVRRGVLGANAWTPKYPQRTIHEVFIRPWCDRLRARQNFYLKTLTVAYVDPDSVAFNDNAMRGRMEANRALLLESPYRYEVDQRDIIDPAFREQMFKSTVGGNLKAPMSPDGFDAPLDGSSDSADASLPPSGGAPFEATASQAQPPGSGSGMALAAVGLAGAAGLAWYVTRRRR